MAKILNNLAYASKQHSRELKRQKAIPDNTEEMNRAEEDEKYITTWLREAIQKNEQHFAKDQNINLEKMQLLEDLTAASDHMLPKPLQSITLTDAFEIQGLERQYFTCIESRHQGRILRNISEYLLETLPTDENQTMQHQKEMAFWFRLGLKYFETINPEEIEKHLILLALFYASKNNFGIADSLYRQAIEKMEKENDKCYSLVMAKNLYGRLLMRDPQM